MAWTGVSRAVIEKTVLKMNETWYLSYYLREYLPSRDIAKPQTLVSRPGHFSVP